MPVRTVLTLLLVALVAIGFSLFANSALAGRSHAGKQHPFLVYKAQRSALEVTLTRHGNRVVRAGVSAPGLCEDGERFYAGFGTSGGGGIRIDRHGRFIERNGPRSYLRGHFDESKVIGAFRESRRRNVVGEALEPLCGNIVPRGRNQRFVARLVEVEGKKIHQRN